MPAYFQHRKAGWSLSWKSGKSQGKRERVKIVREFGGKEESQGKSGNFDRLSGAKSSPTPQVELDDLSFLQNDI